MKHVNSQTCHTNQCRGSYSKLFSAAFYAVTFGEGASSLLVNVQNETLLPQKSEGDKLHPTLFTGTSVSGAKQ